MNIRILGRVAALATVALTLAACGSEADRAYAACVDKMEEAVAEATREGGAAAAAMVEMTRSMATAACEGLREVCRNDPQGAMCQGAIAEMNK